MIDRRLLSLVDVSGYLVIQSLMGPFEIEESEVVGQAVIEELFAKGLCLPSGSNLTESDLERVVAAIRKRRERKTES